MERKCGKDFSYGCKSSHDRIYYSKFRHRYLLSCKKISAQYRTGKTGDGKIVLVYRDECLDALASAVSDYEDAVIERTAAKAEMDCIITRNVKDYQDGIVKALLPDDFIAFMENGK